MDGFNPNAFLAKKLMTEGLLEDEDTADKPKDKEASIKEKDASKETVTKVKPQESTLKEKSQETTKSKESKPKETETPEKSEEKTKESPKKRLSSESTESNTQVVIKIEDAKDTKEKINKTEKTVEKRKSDQSLKQDEKSPPVKKRKTPIVFDVDKKEKEVVKERERTESVGSDNHVIVTTATNSHKYDALPPCKYILEYRNDTRRGFESR